MKSSQCPVLPGNLSLSHRDKRTDRRKEGRRTGGQQARRKKRDRLREDLTFKDGRLRLIALAGCQSIADPLIRYASALAGTAVCERSAREDVGTLQPHPFELQSRRPTLNRPLGRFKAGETVKGGEKRKGTSR